jgi:serine/threonine-protein kinase
VEDVSFLALLVHRGVLPQRVAERLLPEIQGGAALDRLLVERLGLDPAAVQRLRRTRCGEIPEIPGYDVLRRLGVGGTADVFRARDKKSLRVFALKVLSEKATRDEKVRKAFVNEARLLERLEHRGLVKGYGVARSGTTYFSRLAYVEGATLLELLEGGRVFREEEVLRIALEVAEVLAYLESQGIVHRDVKPGNIMLDESGRVVLIDLGFAAAESAACAAESAVGTVQYLSPEQARGGASADCRSDIYSLGISLFHIVVGRLPFESSDDREVLRMQVMQSLAAPELRGRRVSPLLQYFIEKMVAKDAAHRYQSWRELIEDVRAHLAGRENLDFEKEERDRPSQRPRRQP